MFCRDFSMTSLHNSCSLHNESAHKKKKKPHRRNSSRMCTKNCAVVDIRLATEETNSSFQILHSPLCKNPEQQGLECTASEHGNVLVPLSSEKYSCNCLVFLLE